MHSNVEISNSMKPSPSLVHAYISKSRPAIGLFVSTITLLSY